MKSFTDLLTEKKDHIIKKMPLLSDEEKISLIAFFKKKSNLESKIDWNKWKKLKYEDFLDVMSDTKTSRKRKAQKQRHKGIKGLKESEDYVHIRTKNQEYLVYIPLHEEASKIIASVNIGNCHGKWCIANSQARRYYRTQAKRPGKIPVMVIGNGQKYTVMINPDNAKWEVWDKENARATYGEDIPNFSIKKELMTSRIKKVYDEIRDDIWKRQKKSRTGNAEYDAAVDDYVKLGIVVEEYQQEHEDERDEYYDEITRIKNDTIKKYETLAFEAEKAADNHITGAHKGFESKVLSFRMAMRERPQGDIINNGVKEWLIANIGVYKSGNKGVYYSEREINAFIDTYKSEFGKGSDPDYTMRDMYNEIVEGIEDADYYELENFYFEYLGKRIEIDWIEDIPYEESLGHIEPPDTESYEYENYFDFLEEYAPDNFEEFDHETFRYAMYDLSDDGNIEDGEDVLEGEGLPHPKEIVEDYEENRR